MAVVKVKLKKDDCKGEEGDICKMSFGVNVLGFTFDKCETCLGVFNYKKDFVVGEQVVEKVRVTKKPKKKPTHIQSKMF